MGPVVVISTGWNEEAVLDYQVSLNVPTVSRGVLLYLLDVESHSVAQAGLNLTL